MRVDKEKIKKIISEIKKNKIEFLLLFLILLIASFLRFYKIPETLGFFGDEGRDALVVKRMIVDHKYTLIGPVTSIGNMYLGPLYYYMMIVPMMIFKLDPIGASYMVALIGVITVWLVYYLGKKFYHWKIGLLTAFLYSLSAIVVKGSRSSWNPNPMPFFALILIFSLYKVYVEKRYRWLIVTGLSFGCALQMHYFGLVFLPVIGVIWLLVLKEELKVKKNIKKFILATCYMLLATFILTLPLIIFDFRHNFINYQAILRFFHGQEPSFSIFITLKNIEGRTQNFIGSLFTYNWQKNLTIFYLIGIIIGSYLGLIKKEFKKSALIIISWLVIGILGLAAYYGDIYPHYLAFLFPAPFFLFALFIERTFKSLWGKGLTLVLIGIFIYFNIKYTPYKTLLAWNITKVRMLASMIAQDTKDKEYNVVWISSVKDYRAMNYRYFLEIMGKKPLEPEEYFKAKVLYVVVEAEKVNPIDYPIWEIQSFGKAKVEKTFSIINGPLVYKLIKK